MERIYKNVIKEHITNYRQMLFIAGPRQSGKTTVAQMTSDYCDEIYYFNWDNQDHRQTLISGPEATANAVNLHRLKNAKPVIIFDEIHKYAKWKLFLKGFFDTYQDKISIIVTGSSRLDIYKSAGDSLMGRYLLYRLHPFSVGEIANKIPTETEIKSPSNISDALFDNLITFGGYPEPYLKADKRFYNRWRRLRSQQLFHEDLRDLTRIQEMGQLELLAKLLIHQAGDLTNYSNLANKINVSVDTIRRWLITLESIYYCFALRPWSKNVSRSLLKEPKVYLWDWSLIEDKGKRLENLVACHLLKSVHFWTDYGLGNYGLYYLRDKQKREVDFLVTKDEKPWFMVEVKASANTPLNKALFHFQDQIAPDHSFQVVLDADYVDQDCFIEKGPLIVPAKTFLSQLI